MRTWEELSVVEQLQSNYSDAYKDAYGFRPRSVRSELWNSEEWLRNELAYLSDMISRQIDEEAAAEARAAAQVEQRIEQLIAMGAGDRNSAIRWLHQAEGTDGDNEYLCYALGLPYHYFKDQQHV